VVRIYQLKDDARLYNASFEQMWHSDKATLGEDIVKADELQAYPATRTDIRFERAEPVQHIVAVALVQEPKGHSWFCSFDLPPPPEAGKCSGEACQEDDEECVTRAAATPHYAFWIDGSTIDDGIEHLEEFPRPGGMPRWGP
jgi:predicted component of type VI protein secretion system